MRLSHAQAMMGNEGRIFAFDRDGRRLKTMMTLMRQRHVTCVEACEKEPPNRSVLELLPYPVVDCAYSWSSLCLQYLIFRLLPIGRLAT